MSETHTLSQCGSVAASAAATPEGGLLPSPFSSPVIPLGVDESESSAPFTPCVCRLGDGGGVAEERWWARLAQLLSWAVQEEHREGDIHLALSCYTEAVLLVYRAVARPGVDPGDKAALKATLACWTHRALLLQSIIAEEGVTQAAHPLLKPLPSCIKERPLHVEFQTDLHNDPLLRDVALSRREGEGEEEEKRPEPIAVLTAVHAAASLDLPLPPSVAPVRQAEVCAPPENRSGVWGGGGGVGGGGGGAVVGSVDDDDFAAVFDKYLRKHKRGAEEDELYRRGDSRAFLHPT